MNPLDMPGPDFLGLYLTLAFAALIVALLLRAVWRFPWGAYPDFAKLNGIEAAYLAGGANRVVQTAVGALLKRKAVAMGEEPRSLKAHKRLASEAHPVEAAIVDALVENGELEFDQLEAAIKPQLEVVEEKLRQEGLHLSHAHVKRLRAAICVVVVPLLLLGVAKIAVGISRDRPVGALIVFCLITVGGLVMLLRKPPQRTFRGAAALKSLKKQYAALRVSAANKEHKAWNVKETSMAYGLFGATALAAVDERTRTLLAGASSASDSDTWWHHDSCSSSGCSSGDSGCGSSCGGCGGGD